MKKQFILCALAMCLLLTGCETAPGPQADPGVSDPLPGSDAQNQYALFDAISFQESDSFFCGGSMLGDSLYYYDKETGISGILCADPSCSHDGSSCSAFVKRGAAMFLYNGQRYWITDDYSDGQDPILWQGDIVGTNQKKVKTISFENILLPYQPQQYAIHRGSLYFLGEADTVSGANAGRRITLMASPLDASEEFTPLFDQTYDRYATAEVRFIGGYAYFLVKEWTAGTIDSVDLALYQIDLTDGQTEILYEEWNGTSCGGFWVTESGEIYLSKKASVCKVENGTLATVGTLKHSADSVALMDGIAVSSYLENDQRCVEIMDFSGSTLYDGPMFPLGVPEMDGDPNQYKTYSLLIVGGDCDKLIVDLSRFDGESSGSWLVLLDLNHDLEPTLLWKAQ